MELEYVDRKLVTALEDVSWLEREDLRSLVDEIEQGNFHDFVKWCSRGSVQNETIMSFCKVLSDPSAQVCVGSVGIRVNGLIQKFEKGLELDVGCSLVQGWSKNELRAKIPTGAAATRYIPICMDDSKVFSNYDGSLHLTTLFCIDNPDEKRMRKMASCCGKAILFDNMYNTIRASFSSLYSWKKNLV